jgi:hypothetical protein
MNATIFLEFPYNALVRRLKTTIRDFIKTVIDMCSFRERRPTCHHDLAKNQDNLCGEVGRRASLV